MSAQTTHRVPDEAAFAAGTSVAEPMHRGGGLERRPLATTLDGMPSTDDGAAPPGAPTRVVGNGTKR